MFAKIAGQVWLAKFLPGLSDVLFLQIGAVFEQQLPVSHPAVPFLVRTAKAHTEASKQQTKATKAAEVLAQAQGKGDCSQHKRQYADHAGLAQGSSASHEKPNYKMRGPDPSTGSGARPTREDFQLANAWCIIFDPEMIWPDLKLRKCMVCTGCHRTDKVQMDGFGKVRSVVGDGAGGTCFLMARKYRCRGCPGEQAIDSHW